jgi:1,4-dihydroxy-2-naphthoate octaprenyltransferase
MWRVWLGIVLVIFFGVPVFTVLSWMVGGVLGFIFFGVVGVLIVIYMFSNKSN